MKFVGLTIQANLGKLAERLQERTAPNKGSVEDFRKDLKNLKKVVDNAVMAW